MDSFKRLLEDDDDEFAIPELKLRDIEKRINRSSQQVRLVANTADLFVPQAVNAMLAMFGAKIPRRQKPNSPSVGGHLTDPANM